MQTVYGVGEYRAGEAAFTVGSREFQMAARRAVICVGGAGRTAAADFTNVTTGQTLANLADAGYPIHVGDYCGHGTAYWSAGAWTWGNSEATTAIAAGATAIAATTKAGKLMLFGGSMGAVDALNYYHANPTKVAAIALAIPLLDLNDLSSNDKGFIGAVLGSAVAPAMYGLTLPQGTITLNENISVSGLAAAGIGGAGAPGANKVNVLTSNGWQLVTFTGIAGTSITGCTGGTGTLSAASTVSQGYGATLVAAYGVAWPALLSGPQLTANSPQVWAETAGGLTVPTQIWASDNDYIASNTAACQAWAAAVAAAGGGNVTPTVISMGNAGHNSSILDARQVAAFFDANGGRT